MLSNLCLAIALLAAKPVHHYTFFGMDRELLHASSQFLQSSIFEGAQVAYSWKQLEPRKDDYDFTLVREDLTLLTSHGKKLWVQIQDVTFTNARTGVPRYLTEDPQYHGGVAQQYLIDGDDEAHAKPLGFAARRWDPVVQARFYKLLDALGKEFDGRITGVNLDESSVTFGMSGKLHPSGFTFEGYRDAIIANMKALKRAFPKSIALQYANFMPGEWRPTDDKGYLRAVYAAAKELKVGVGGPDVLPNRPGQMGTSYPLIKEASEYVPVGIAVQDGNLEEIDRKTGKRVTVAELFEFARDYLHADYIFWGTQEPYYSSEVVPFLRRQGE